MGVSVVFGGQWGSEGNGKTTLFFAKKFNASTVVRVGGTNSGHSIVDSKGERSGISKQNLRIHPNAVIITKKNKRSENEYNLNLSIGSTESGTGDAVISRIKRDRNAVLAKDIRELDCYICDTCDFLRDELRRKHEVIIEGTQGFGLSVLHSKEYPYTTSRDTSAAAFVSEAGLSPFDVKNIIMTLRAFPIRVAGNSGPLPKETTWGEVTRLAGSEKILSEKTTVTKRVRRVAFFDDDVVRRSMVANTPNIIVLNHCDYFDYSINNKCVVSNKAEVEIKEIEAKIGSINYIGTGDSVLVKR